MTSLSLDRLPIEIQLEIYQHLPPSVLSILSACSKDVNNVTVPLLYSNVRNLHSPESQASFFLALVAKPYLIQLVQSLECEALYSGEDVTMPYGTLDLSTAGYRDRSWIREQLPKSLRDDNFRDGWLTAMFSANNWNAVFAFQLFLLSKNLTYLRISDFGVCFQSPYLTTLVKHLSLYPELCPKLVEIKLECAGRRKVNHMEHIMPFLRLKSATILNVQRLSPPKLKGQTTTGHPPSEQLSNADAFTHVKQMTLTTLDLGRSSLDLLLSKFTNLNSFSYTRKSGRRRRDDGFSLLCIAKALLSAKASLQSLHLVSECDIFSFSDVYEETGFDDLQYVGSLVEFENLTHVEADACVLIGWEIHERGTPSIGNPYWPYALEDIDAFTAKLPSSLEELVITKCRLPVLDCLALLLREASTRLRSLKLISLVFISDDSRIAEEWPRWLEAAAGQGITLKLAYTCWENKQRLIQEEFP